MQGVSQDCMHLTFVYDTCVVHICMKGTNWSNCMPSPCSLNSQFQLMGLILTQRVVFTVPVQGPV